MLCNSRTFPLYSDNKDRPSIKLQFRKYGNYKAEFQESFENYQYAEHRGLSSNREFRPVKRVIYIPIWWREIQFAKNILEDIWRVTRRHKTIIIIII